MWKSNLELDKYLYVRTSPYLIRGFGFIGLVTTLLMAYGYFRFINVAPVYLIVFGPIAAVFVTNKVMRYFIQLFYPKFDIKKHEAFISDYWQNNPEPSVDVFLPWAGEDLDMHEEVLKAVAQIDYKNIKVYMLDDKGDQHHKMLAEKYGFTHLSRPNKGEHKKSGNLEYGYRNSNGQFVLILDADFIPTKNALKDLVPYIATNEKIGILQSPQYLEQDDHVHKRSMIEYGGGNIVEDFYKINLPSRDVFKAAMCVGTSAIYRRTAIEALQGTPKVHASEDLATGFLVTEHGYYVKYLPLIVSMGKSPETFQGYFKQHHRWCSGNLVFANYWPRARMNVVARLIYLSNPTYYLSEALSVIFSFHFLVLLFFHSESLSIANTIYFLPYVIFSRLMMPLIKSHKTKIGTKLAALSNSYTYIYTYLHMLLKGVPKWHPTGVKTGKVHEDFVSSINIGIFFSIAFILCFLLIIYTKPYLLGDYNNYLILGWSIYSTIWHAGFLYMAYRYIVSNKVKNMNSIVEKGVLYAKAHAVPVLTIALASSFIIKMPAAIMDTNSKTRLAIANMTKGPATPDSISTPLPIIAQETAQETVPFDVLGEVSAEDEDLYRYEVVSGDSLIELAERAVVDYISIFGVVLEQRQINYAASRLVTITDYNRSLHPGDIIDFEPKMVEEMVVEAQAK